MGLTPKKVFDFHLKNLLKGTRIILKQFCKNEIDVFFDVYGNVMICCVHKNCKYLEKRRIVNLHAAKKTP